MQRYGVRKEISDFRSAPSVSCNPFFSAVLSVVSALSAVNNRSYLRASSFICGYIFPVYNTN
jgi:hypothetical protein